MQRELIRAIVFFVVCMAIAFTPILYKNHWTILFNNTYHEIF
jgi:hypothetical protein